MSLEIEDIAFEQLGTGQTLVMLHGWNRSGADLRPLGELLAPYAKVFLIDLPGFGKTPAPPLEGWDTSQYADLIVSFLKSRGVESATFLGHSFGGRVSLRISAKYPSLVKSIILIDSHGLRPVRSVWQNLRVWSIKRAAKIVKFIDRVFKTTLFPDSFAKKFGSPDYQNAGVLKNTFVKTVSEDQIADVKQIQVPALLLWGSEDRETPVAMGKRFNEILKDSKLIVMDGKGHSPFHGVGAHLCANYIVPFLERKS